MKDLLNRSIASLWETLPAGSIALLLDSDQIVTLPKLLDFYNSYHRSASSKRYTPEYSILLANYYIHEEENDIVASNLVFNANFLWYVNTWPTTVGCAIDHFKERATSWASNNSNLTEDELYKLTTRMEFPRMYESYNIASYDGRSIGKMKAYTTNTVNRDYRHRALTPTNKVVDSLLNSGEYEGKKSRNRSSRIAKGKKEEETEEVDDKEIDIVFVDEQSKEKRMKIGKSTKLKSLFDNYAEERSASLRSLRFSREGSTLFLSSVGKKTPTDLNLSDGATITVTHLISQTDAVDKATTAIKASKSMSMGTKGTKKSPSSKKRTKGKQKKKAQPSNKPQLVAEETEEALKIEHSKRLSKIHEEAQPRFQHIRQRLNNLVLERSKPKVKSKKNKALPLQPIEQHTNNPPSDGLGGKAGKTHYTIQVGEISNLYKTSKRQRRSTSSSTDQKVLKLDLHGLTKYEALKTLDESLPRWHNMAMAGSYPFVIPLDIVCGGGSQVLSEVVETWIKSNDHVANAPKSKSTTWCGRQ